MALSEAQRRRIDAAMLESLSTWFTMRARGYFTPHSFNDEDVSAMLARAAALVTPRPVGVAGRAALGEKDSE